MDRTLKFHCIALFGSNVVNRVLSRMFDIIETQLFDMYIEY